MSLNKFFYSVASLLLLAAAFIFVSPFFVAPDLIYPVRVDSLYVKYESEQMAKSISRDTIVRSSVLLFNPSSLGMKYENVTVKTTAGIELHGWYVAGNDEDEETNTLLIIHDLSQSKINCLNLIKQMHDRDLNVCVVDMRAHGTSGGDEFSPGMVAVTDTRNVMDYLLKKPGTHHLAIFGTGMGAAVGIQAAGMDSRCEALVVQSPFSDFSSYVDSYAKRKWGRMSFVFRSVLERALEKRLQYDLSDLNLSEVVKYVKTPTLFICAANDVIVPAIETYAVYDSSAAKEKNLILVKKAGHDNIEQVGGEDYYNAIARFIQNAIPKKPKETRYKKLAAK